MRLSKLGGWRIKWQESMGETNVTNRQVSETRRVDGASETGEEAGRNEFLCVRFLDSEF